jgi:hypothetical protein
MEVIFAFRHGCAGDNLLMVLLAEAEERLNPQLSLFSVRKDHWEKLAP